MKIIVTMNLRASMPSVIQRLNHFSLDECNSDVSLPGFFSFFFAYVNLTDNTSEHLPEVAMLC